MFDEGAGHGSTRDGVGLRELMSTIGSQQTDPLTLDELSTFAHDLRTPLAAIGGFVQLLEIGAHGSVTAAQSAALERIRVNQEKAVALITEFMENAERRLRERDLSNPDSTSDAARS